MERRRRRRLRNGRSAEGGGTAGCYATPSARSDLGFIRSAEENEALEAHPLRYAIIRLVLEFIGQPDKHSRRCGLKRLPDRLLHKPPPVSVRGGGGVKEGTLIKADPKAQP